MKLAIKGRPYLFETISVEISTGDTTLTTVRGFTSSLISLTRLAS